MLDAVNPFYLMEKPWWIQLPIYLASIAFFIWLWWWYKFKRP